MSTAEEAFLSDIRASPDDDGPRLIYADWLEENGHPERAEFIRVQIELSRLNDDGPRREALEDRQDELLAAHGDEWRSASLYPYCRPPEDARFHRGFLEEALLPTPDKACAVLRSAPVRRLEVEMAATAKGLAELVRLPEFAQVRELKVGLGRVSLKALGLLRSPRLARLQSLSLWPGDRVNEALEAVGSSPHLRALTRLEIDSHELGDEGLGILARSPLLARLQGLRVSGHEIQLPGARALINSPLAAGLTDLDLGWWSEIGDAGGHALAAATHLRHLTSLHPAFGLEEEGAAALASAGHLGSLRCLDLSGNEIRDEGLRAVVSAPQWAGLRELNLHRNVIGPDGLGYLTRSPTWRGLTKLTLADTGFIYAVNSALLGDAGAAAIAGSPCLEELEFCASEMGPRGAWELAGRDFPRLESLELSYNEMRDEGLGHLLSRGRFPRLRRLSVRFAELTSAGVRALAASPLLDRLTELKLTHNQIGDQGAAALAASRRTSRLRRLELDECGVGEEGAQALARSPHLERLQWLNLHQQQNRLLEDSPAADLLIQRFGNRVWF